MQQFCWKVRLQLAESTVGLVGAVGIVPPAGIENTQLTHFA